MNGAFLSITSNLSADNWRHSSYQRSAGASVAQAINTVVLLLEPRGSRGEERLISGSTSPPGVSCSTGFAQNRRASWANTGGQIGADQGDTDDRRTGWDEPRADQLHPLSVCWYTRSVHMSTSIDFGGRGGLCIVRHYTPGSSSGLVSSPRKQGFIFGCWEEVRLNRTFSLSRPLEETHLGKIFTVWGEPLAVRGPTASHLWLCPSLSSPRPQSAIAVESRNAATPKPSSLPPPTPVDFLLINPGEWQGWHSLSRRLWEAPGILPSSKHLPASQVVASLGPLVPPNHHHQLLAYEIPKAAKPRHTFEGTRSERSGPSWSEILLKQLTEKQRKTGLSARVLFAQWITGKYQLHRKTQRSDRREVRCVLWHCFISSANMLLH